MTTGEAADLQATNVSKREQPAPTGLRRGGRINGSCDSANLTTRTQPRLRARRWRTNCLKSCHTSSLCGPWKARQIQKTITRTTTQGATSS